MHNFPLEKSFELGKEYILGICGREACKYFSCLQGCQVELGLFCFLFLVIIVIFFYIFIHVIIISIFTTILFNHELRVPSSSVCPGHYLVLCKVCTIFSMNFVELL